MKNKKILAVTGIRSEWDILCPVLKEFEKDSNYEVNVMVSGAHLSNVHGYTYHHIEKAGFRIVDRVDSLLSTDRVVQRAKGTGLLIYGIAQTIEREKPDFIICVGDREEAIASAVVANYMNTCMIHLAGGDPVYLNADDPVRFAVSKLAHVHCTFAEDYAQNLRKLGEEHFRITCCGNPSLDNIKNTPRITLQEVSAFLNLDLNDGRYGVVIKHPLSSEKAKSEEQMKLTLEALVKFCYKFDFKFVGTYPNTDPGASPILEVIKSYEGCKNIHFFKTLPHDIFANLIRNCKVLTGNSSMGILEAPFYGLPVVNIGNRQTGRLNAGNVIFVNHDIREIVRELQKACFDESYRTYVKNLISPYGDGDSAVKIKRFVDTIDLSDNKWLTKHKLI
jgi:GDP/UDP-N,N'-diacetylbacillosamine 2-epimerase (hydrolysing)